MTPTTEQAKLTARDFSLYVVSSVIVNTVTAVNALVCGLVIAVGTQELLSHIHYAAFVAVVTMIVSLFVAYKARRILPNGEVVYRLPSTRNLGRYFGAYVAVNLALGALAALSL